MLERLVIADKFIRGAREKVQGTALNKILENVAPNTPIEEVVIFDGMVLREVVSHRLDCDGKQIFQGTIDNHVFDTLKKYLNRLLNLITNLPSIECLFQAFIDNWNAN